MQLLSATKVITSFDADLHHADYAPSRTHGYAALTRPTFLHSSPFIRTGIHPGAIEAAIRLNGTAVDMNLAAFKWGRLFIAEPARVTAALAVAQKLAVPDAPLSPQAESLITPLGATDELLRVLRLRVPELIAYQNLAYAGRYIDLVRKVAQAEGSRAGGGDALTMAVAKNLYKLMAYKDEYEVARLHLSSAAQASISKTFGADAKIAWHFHPTFLRSLGVKKKIKVGAWFRPALQLLQSLKVLRGTSLDLLGHTRVRRIERELVTHYMATLDALCQRLDPASYPLAVELAQAPDLIRGYEHVKLGNVSKYLALVDGLQRRLGITVPRGPELSSVPFEPVRMAELLKAA